MIRIDGFDLIALLVILATVTSWISIYVARDKEGYIASFDDMKFPTALVAVGWIAVVVVGVWIQYG